MKCGPSPFNLLFSGGRYQTWDAAYFARQKMNIIRVASVSLFSVFFTLRNVEVKKVFIFQSNLGV